ncbi:RNA polymerase sigma factor [Candidatus Giovannonibacteria bacterium]|nr:RNA polymerase sigma factor [Candidatus Giovannonibacteria bacterium]
MTNKKLLRDTFEKYAGAIYRFCYVRIRSKEVAEEIVQETFIRFWKYMESGNEVYNIKSFLYRISNNLIIDYSRKRNARWRKEESLENLIERNQKFEPSYSGGEKIEEDVLFRQVMDNIKKLPREYQEILILRYVEGLAPKEIAEIKNTKPHNVSMKINRATKALRELK